MYKRIPSNYSLWPQQARPRRSKRLTLAGGGIAIGVGCAITAYFVIAAFSVLYDFVGPATVQEPASQRVAENILTVMPAVAEPVEPVNRRSRTRARAAKVTLPVIGSQAALPSAGTDGRGGEGLADVASVAPWASSSEPALQPPAEAAIVEQANLATASERPINPRKKIVRKKRERPTYAARRQKRERPTTYAARYYQRPFAVGLVSPTSIWY
jgi:hypothetical protein